ncbi:tRNA (guanine(37)-N(1))-methyltransferase [Rhodnius prolixus]|uniref:tRNA (guanine(37)-N(1))-methyltransferase n=1 Tax=Rhodnius prolixus TaxID=13249 RepID=UPI003D18BE23
MKTLNKELFEKIVQVPCIVVELNYLKETLKHVKPYMLKLVNLNPVRIRNDDSKEILLNPGIVRTYEDLKVVDREALSNFSDKIHFEHINITLNYNNWNAAEILSSVIPKEIGTVSSYSIIGHIVHLNLKSELFDFKNIIGQVLLDKVSPAKTVVNKMDIIENEFRTFQLEVLAGKDDFVVEVVENGYVYKFDFSKVYWNPRLSTEHLRIVEMLKKGDYLYDVCAGVGPFTIPAAKKGCTVLANDLNDVAINYLRANLLLNKVKSPVLTTVKDATDFIKEDFKSHFIQLKPGDYKVHITMNLPALAPTFLPSFKGLYSAADAEKIAALPVPQVYVYCFVKGVSDPSLLAVELIAEHLNLKGLEDELKSVTFVRNVAPNKHMMRVTIALTPRILISAKRCSSPFDQSHTKKTNLPFLSQAQDTKNEKSEEKQSI